VAFNLLDIGRDKQEGTFGGATFRGKHSRNGAGMEWIHSQTVQRIGWQRDNTTGFNYARGHVEPARLLTGGTNVDSPHSANSQ